MANFDAIELDTLQANPYCTHGPTILFQNNLKNAKFYACSAMRDHKKCAFHQDHQVFSEAQLDKWLRIYKQSKKHLKSVQKIPKRNRSYCRNCQKFLVSDTDKGECVKQKHELIENIKKFQLQQPCKYILTPITDNQSNAQYLFDDRTTQYFKKVIQTNGYDAVLCIGTPSLFENLQQIPSIKRLLLDIDERYLQFYPTTFCLYNMFNHHFFIKQKKYLNFLKNSKNLLVIVDPPYGGLVKLMANTIECIKKDYKRQDASFILIYPYFNEDWIVKWLPNFQMADYKVSYKNQRKFSDGMKKGSPARLFTNITAIGQIEIPKAANDEDNEESYWFCAVCSKYTFQNNRHCDKCGKCTSKDGGVYRHCNRCAKCVKATYMHCTRCDFCHLNEKTKCKRQLNDQSNDLEIKKWRKY